ncbi:MAG TPA: hypothetical protein VNI55_13975 [Gaiellaceae bacterium]|nr:hypothetical protein [Gaiellaceae bacterium]
MRALHLDAQIVVRLPSDLDLLLREYAASYGRSASQEFRLALAAHAHAHALALLGLPAVQERLGPERVEEEREQVEAELAALYAHAFANPVRDPDRTPMLAPMIAQSGIRKTR